MGKNIAIAALGVAVVGLVAYIVIDKRKSTGPAGGAAPYVPGQPNDQQVGTDALGRFILNPFGLGIL